MRDKYSDLMLVLIKDILVKYKHIKFILIGTAVNMEFFQKYFNHCPIVSSKFESLFIIEKIKKIINLFE